MPSVADLDGCSIPEAGEISHDSGAQDQFHQFDAIFHYASSGLESSFLLPALKQST